MKAAETKKNPAGMRFGALGLAACATLASPFAAADVGNWYVGANAGVSQAKIDDPRISAALLGSGFASTTIVDDNRDSGFKLFGGYQFTPNFALEGGYFDLGRFGFKATTVPTGTFDGSIKLRGVNLDLVGRLPLTDRLSAFARVGVDRAEARDAFTGSGAVRVVNPNPHTTATNYKFGGGLQYDFTPALGMRVEAERYRINDAVGNKGDINLYSVGLVYRFGQASPSPMPIAAAAPPPAPAPEPVRAAPTPAPAPVAPALAQVAFSADALFDFDKATIKPAGKTALDRFLADLRGARIDALKVTGHTDRIGSHAYNLKLSASRAEAVKAYLVSGGIAGDLIAAVGVDGEHPVTKPGDCKGAKPTPKLIACLAPDRRVEVEVSGTR